MKTPMSEPTSAPELTPDERAWIKWRDEEVAARMGMTVEELAKIPPLLPPEVMAEFQRQGEELAAMLGLSMDGLLNLIHYPGGAVLDGEERPKPPLEYFRNLPGGSP